MYKDIFENINQTQTFEKYYILRDNVLYKAKLIWPYFLVYYTLLLLL